MTMTGVGYDMGSMGGCPSTITGMRHQKRSVGGLMRTMTGVKYDRAVWEVGRVP